MFKTLLALATASMLLFTAQTPQYDLLIRNGRIIDGSGRPAYNADLAVKGEAPRGGPWRLAIEQPSMLRGEARLVVSLTDQGLVTSGEYRNFYELDGERFSHTIDPTTGYPVRHRLVSVSVIAPTAAEADAWATAMSVLGEERGMALAEREQLPVYMVLIQDEGFADQHSSAFERFRQQTL